MDHHLLGGTFALLAAVSWAFAMILFKRGGEKVSPLVLNLFKGLLSLVLLVPTLWALEGLAALKAYTLSDVGILALSGFLGITVADTLFFQSLNLAGVGIISIVNCLYMPFIIIFSWLLLAERLSLIQYGGAAMIMAAVYIASRHEPPKNRTRGQLVAGILIGVVDMAVMTFGIVIAKPVLEKTPLIASTLIRSTLGMAFLIPIILLLPQRRELPAVFRPSRVWLVTVPASILGAYLALVFWVGGFKNTHASVAGTLNQTSSVFAIVLAAVFLKEAFTRRKAVAVVLAMGGIAMVMIPSILREIGA